MFLFVAVQFDKAGRPFHFLYYTAKQNYYDVLHVRSTIFIPSDFHFCIQTAANKMEELKKAEVALYASGQEPDYAQNE